jgi:hypothetical protein
MGKFGMEGAQFMFQCNVKTGTLLKGMDGPINK